VIYTVLILRQWLPPDKISALGVNSEYDQKSLSQSRSSKRSVREAFSRARLFLEKANKQPHIQVDSELSESELD